MAERAQGTSGGAAALRCGRAEGGLRNLPGTPMARARLLGRCRPDTSLKGGNHPSHRGHGLLQLLRLLGLKLHVRVHSREGNPQPFLQVIHPPAELRCQPPCLLTHPPVNQPCHGVRQGRGIRWGAAGLGSRSDVPFPDEILHAAPPMAAVLMLLLPRLLLQHSQLLRPGPAAGRATGPRARALKRGWALSGLIVHSTHRVIRGALGGCSCLLFRHSLSPLHQRVLASIICHA